MTVNCIKISKIEKFMKSILIQIINIKFSPCITFNFETWRYFYLCRYNYIALSQIVYLGTLVQYLIFYAAY